MQIKKFFFVLGVSITAVLLLLSFTALWTVLRSDKLQSQVSLSHSEVSKYLELSAQTFRTFKLIRRDLTGAAPELSFSLELAEFRLLENVSALREIAQRELDMGLPAAEVANDFERVDQIGTQVGIAFSKVRDVVSLLQNNRVAEAQILLDSGLTDAVDNVLGELIEDGIKNEYQDLVDALEKAQQFHNQSVLLAIAGIGLGIVTSALVIYALVFRVNRSFKRLESDICEFRRRDFDYESQVRGQHEFANISRALNEMAVHINRERDRVRAANEGLSAEVEQRTLELRKANEELTRIDQHRTQFFTEIGHELRTPIAAIRGEAEVTLRQISGKNELCEEALSRIVSSSEAMTQFVSDIFLIAREKAGVAVFRKDQIDLNEIVDGARHQTESLARMMEAQVFFTFQDNPAWVLGDNQKLRQAIVTLVQNAIYHSPSKVNVRVWIESTADAWIVVVQDDGPGISPEEASFIFERYRRGVDASENTTFGTGLGLAVAKAIARAHHGDLAVNPEYSSGAEFRLSLPVLKDVSQD